MFSRTSAIISSFSFLLLSILLAASTASAEVHIFEIQAVPANDPQKLVIWGTDFGNVSAVSQTPVIYIGTETDPLVISADQSL